MDNSILIENGHIIDPSQGIDGVGDLLIENGKIKGFGNTVSEIGKKEERRSPAPNP